MRCHKSIAYLCAAVLISITTTACKPKPVDSSAAAAPATGAPSAPNSQAGVDDTTASDKAAAHQPGDEKPHHSHVHSDSNADINAVADKLDPAVKADLARLIEERKYAKPQVVPLPGGGERVQLNGSHSSIAVAVANDDGEVTIYHHGENLKLDASSDPHAATQLAPTKTLETVKPYPPVKKISAPTSARD